MVSFGEISVGCLVHAMYVGTWSKNGVLWREFWVIVRNLQENNGWILWPQLLFFLKTLNCSWSLTSAVVIYSYTSVEEKHVFTTCGFLSFIHVTLNTQSINCLMFRIQLVIAWDFSLPNLSAPFPKSHLLQSDTHVLIIRIAFLNFCLIIFT